MIKPVQRMPRAVASSLTLLSLLSIAACGGGIGGEPPKQAMNLSQVNLNCVQQPGEACSNVQATVMLNADVTDQRPLWEEKPAVGGSKVFDRVKPIKQADGSWIMDFSVRQGLAEGTYTGTVDFSVAVSPYPGTPNYQPRTASYRIAVAGLKGQLNTLQALAGAGDWEGTNGNAAHTGLVPVSLDAGKFSRRWTWEYNGVDKVSKVSPVVAANGLVYFSVEQSAADSPGSTKISYTNTLIALSESDSAEKWRTPQTLNNGLSAPGLSGTRLAMVDTNSVFTFDAISGARLATVRQPQTTGLLTAVSPLTAPTLAGANVYVGGNNDVISSNATTAQNNWSSSLGLSILANVDEWTPAVNASTVYSNTAGTLRAFNRVSGTQQWSLAVPGQVLGGLAKSSLRQAPVLPDDHTVLLLNQRPVAGSSADNSLSLVDTDSRQLRWTVNGQFTTQPVTSQGLVYVGNQATSSLEARGLATGAVVWSWPLSAVQEERFGGDLIVTNNLLFIAGEKGTYALDLASQKAVWSYRLAGKLALSRNGLLYIRTANESGIGVARLTAINLQ
ncbi:MAG: hypothetical protein RLZZ237_2536 [Pseudomonadota bacterium]|jgi:hypothetical protein